MLNVGLTGGVGSGKSTIAAMLSARGAGVVDADLIAHELTRAGGAAIEPLQASFGASAIAADGSLDRDRMRSIAFADPVARKRLEAVLHPLIRAAMRERATSCAAAGSSYVVFVVPLLIESGRPREYTNRLLIIDCALTTQIARVCKRSSLSEGDVRSIIAAQASRAERLAVADDVLLNEAPLADVEPRVDRLHRMYLHLSGSHGSIERHARTD